MCYDKIRRRKPCMYTVSVMTLKRREPGQERIKYKVLQYFLHLHVLCSNVLITLYIHAFQWIRPHFCLVPYKYPIFEFLIKLFYTEYILVRIQEAFSLWSVQLIETFSKTFLEPTVLINQCKVSCSKKPLTGLNLCGQTCQDVFLMSLLRIFEIKSCRSCGTVY